MGLLEKLDLSIRDEHILLMIDAKERQVGAEVTRRAVAGLLPGSIDEKTDEELEAELSALQEKGFVSIQSSNKEKAIYSLTDPGKQLVKEIADLLDIKR